MFELVRDVVSELHPNFQIIITEHADIAEDYTKRLYAGGNGNALFHSNGYPVRGSKIRDGDK